MRTLLAFLAFAPLTAFAEDIVLEPLTDTPFLTPIASGSGGLTEFFNSIYIYLIGLAGVIAVLFTIRYGITLMLSQTPFAISESRAKIFDVFFGLALIVSPVILLGLVDQRIPQGFGGFDFSQVSVRSFVNQTIAEPDPLDDVGGGDEEAPGDAGEGDGTGETATARFTENCDLNFSTSRTEVSLDRMARSGGAAVGRACCEALAARGGVCTVKGASDTFPGGSCDCGELVSYGSGAGLWTAKSDVNALFRVEKRSTGETVNDYSPGGKTMQQRGVVWLGDNRPVHSADAAETVYAVNQSFTSQASCTSGTDTKEEQQALFLRGSYMFRHPAGGLDPVLSPEYPNPPVGTDTGRYYADWTLGDLKIMDLIRFDRVSGTTCREIDFRR